MLRVISKTVEAKKGATYDKSCVMVALPDSLARRIIKWGKENIADEDIYHDGDSKGREDEMHVTVKYGLLTADDKEVRELLKGVKPFSVTLQEVSRFAKPDKEYDVVKIEVDSEDLHDLHALIGDNIENSDDWPEYRPHITIAYIKKGSCYALSGHSGFKDEAFDVSSVVFSSKDGSETVIHL